MKRGGKRREQNRTGIGVQPERAEEMAWGVEEFPPTSHADAGSPAEVRARYAGARATTGSVPLGDARGRKEVPTDLAPLVDKMGARLAFERAGVRLYEALIGKLDVHGSFEGGPTREELVEMRDQERDHFDMLCRTLGGIGADPTALTPSANLTLLAGQGVQEVLVDARTTLLECLEAIMVAELGDHHGWEGLVELAELAGYEMMADRFGDALTTEGEHVARMREWIAVGQGRRPTRH